MNSIRILKHAKGDVQRKDKGRKRPQALRQAKKRAKQLKRKLLFTITGAIMKYHVTMESGRTFFTQFRMMYKAAYDAYDEACLIR